MDNKTTSELSNVAKNFNSNVSTLLKMINVKFGSNMDVIRLLSLVNVTRTYDPLLIIDRCKDKIWAARDKIKEMDEKHFIKKNYSGYIKKDENQQFMRNLVSIITSVIPELKKEEKVAIWNIIQKMLVNVAEYKLILGEYSDK
jgi:hypothetical protein